MQLPGSCVAARASSISRCRRCSMLPETKLADARDPRRDIPASTRFLRCARCDPHRSPSRGAPSRGAPSGSSLCRRRVRPRAVLVAAPADSLWTRRLEPGSWPSGSSIAHRPDSVFALGQSTRLRPGGSRDVGPSIMPDTPACRSRRHNRRIVKLSSCGLFRCGLSLHMAGRQ